MIRIATTRAEHRLVGSLTGGVVRRANRLAHRHQQNRHLKWVPLAYRGAVKEEDAPYSNKKPTRGGGKASEENIQQDLSLLGDGKGGNEETRILSLHKDLVRIAKHYRGCFSSEPFLVQSFRKGVSVEYEDNAEARRAALRAIERQIREIFDGIHQADEFVEWEQIEKTEDLFRGLCRVLQDIVKASTELRRIDDNSDIEEFVDLAELALGTLVKLGSERGLLIEATRTWGSYVPSTRTSSSRYHSSQEDETPGRVASLFNSFNRLFEGFPPKKPPTEEPVGPMAHEDQDLGATQELFGGVMNSIAADVKQDKATLAAKQGGILRGGPLTVPSGVDRKTIDQKARRMIGVLNVMPSSWLPDIEIMKQVMEMLCRAGSLGSARASRDAFKRHPSNQYRLRFSLVLQAYLEATKHEEDDENKLIAAQEAIHALHQEWDVNLPRHRVERINHCSFALNCLCVASRATEYPDAFEAAEMLVKRALGGAGYEALQTGDISKVDTQALPLMNGLAQVSASSGRIEEAKAILSRIMQHGMQGVGRFMVHPLVDTVNTVLFSILREYEGAPFEAEGGQRRSKDCTYALSLLDYMLTQREKGCWPNEETFSYLFRLLLATSPEDIGEQAENLLSMMKIRQSISTRDSKADDSVAVTLSVYHRVLRCWLEAAKKPSTRNAPGRALKLVEKLEVQSTPFLLTDREARSRSFLPLYDTQLRPQHKTLKLVLQICAETVNEDDYEEAAIVATKAYTRMLQAGYHQPSRDAITHCLSRLTPAQQKAVEEAVQPLLLDDNESSSTAVDAVA